MLNALATLVDGASAALGRSGLGAKFARGLGALLVGFTLLAGPLTARAATLAQQANPVTLTARAGFDGYYKDLRWLPVRVTVANDGPDARGTLRVSVPRYQSPDLLVTRAVELPTQSRREIYMYLPVEGYLSTLKVSLVNTDNEEIATVSTRLAQANANDLLYGVVAGSPSAYERILGDVDP